MAIDDILNERIALIDEKKSIEARVAEIDELIVKFMGGREKVTRPDYVITYIAIARPAYMVRATNYMKLTVKDRVKQKVAA
ncbi:MAG: hypothetical protein E6Q97_15605 [Desulfurellales bacterium]|nr:MAG: hypothetical protein E6Q97_15605 [Desulfurellales bacterium]